MRDSRTELMTGIGNDWGSNFGDRDWDYQMEICESMIERVVGLTPGKVSGKYRNGDRQIYFNGRYECSNADGNMGVINDLKNGNTGVWHGSSIRVGNEGGGAWKLEIININ